MMYYPFYILFDLINTILLMSLCLCSQSYRAFSLGLGLFLDNGNNAGLKNLVGKYFFLICFQLSSQKNWYYIFLKYLIDFNSEDIFLCEVFIVNLMIYINIYILSLNFSIALFIGFDYLNVSLVHFKLQFHGINVLVHNIL